MPNFLAKFEKGEPSSEWKVRTEHAIVSKILGDYGISEAKVYDLGWSLGMSAGRMPLEALNEAGYPTALALCKRSKVLTTPEELIATWYGTPLQFKRQHGMDVLQDLESTWPGRPCGVIYSFHGARRTFVCTNTMSSSLLDGQTRLVRRLDGVMYSLEELRSWALNVKESDEWDPVVAFGLRDRR